MICEILNDDGTMARLPDLVKFAKAHDLKMGSIESLIRYRQVEYGRMPLLGYLAMDDARMLTRADFVRLGLVTGPGASEKLPYSTRYLDGFEERYCHDPYWNEEATGG